MRKGIRNIEVDQSEIKQTIFRLAHFDPTCRDGYGHQLVDYLVLDSLAAFGQLKVTALEIKEHIKGCFRLDFEERELNASGKRLAQKEMMVYEERERLERPVFQILPETEQKIRENLINTQKLEDEVIQDWEDELCDKYKEYPIVKDNVERIIENFQLFTSRMFIRHGVECVNLLYPEKRKAYQWLKSVESSILASLPKIDPFADTVARLEIPSFFKHPDSKRKAYITNLFNSSFFWHLVQVDESCSNLLQKVTRGQRLYLDNNILYSLVGLHGPSMLQSVHSMLKLAGALGYELWVTNKTVDEFHNSLTWQMKELKQTPPLPSELARIAVENLEEDSFLTLYWKDFVENGTSIEEFVMEKSHLDDVLQGLNIKTTNKYRKDIEGSQELLDEMRVLRLACINEPNEHIIEHDAFHRVFINKVRRGPKHHFSQAVAWFLTHDSKLPVYDRDARKGKSHLPFCITSDQWVQINRPLLTRTANQEEYEESFYVLITQPFLRTMISTLSLEKAYNEVLGRLARYKSMNPQFALNVVTDKHFMVTMAEETDEAKIEEKLDSKLVDMADQLQREKEILERKVEVQDGEVKSLEEGIEAIQKILEESRKKAEDEKKKRETAEKESEKVKRQLEFRMAVFQWGIFVVGLSLISSLLWLHQLWFDWTWLDNHKNRILIQLASQLLIAFALLNVPLRRHWQLWLKLIVAIIGILFGLVKL